MMHYPTDDYSLQDLLLEYLEVCLSYFIRSQDVKVS